MANLISILIITYNRPADLLELLINISEQTSFKSVVEEILILNNASSDDYSPITQFIKKHTDLKIAYIDSPTNLGVARGRNRLLTHAKGSIILSLDDDMVFTKPDDLLRLSTLFNEPFFRNANTGIITFRVLYYDTKEVQVTAFPHKKYAEYKDKPQFLTAYFAGGAHIMLRDALNTAGLYPEDFHYGMEEYDLSYRILNAGYTIGYDNQVTVLHKESPLGRQANFKKLQMQWVNKSKVAWRYLPIQYFITTAVSWGIQYLKVIKGHPASFFSAIGQIIKIPFTEVTQRISPATLAYLKKVEARLKY
jgi:GT2 family glycosyltransferase